MLTLEQMKKLRSNKFEPTAIGIVLKEIVEQNTKEIYFDKENLTKQLLDRGITEINVLKICLMVEVRGFREIISADNFNKQIELNCYIKKAMEQTGFNKDVVLAFTAEIAYSIGVVVKYEDKNQNINETTENAYVVPYSLYKDDLKEFGDVYWDVRYKKANASKLNFDLLKPLVDAKIPKALFYMGSCLKNGYGLEKNIEQGEALLEEASLSGDVTAVAELADTKYRKGDAYWKEAYDLYTSYASIPLLKNRKANLTNMLNHKARNKKMLIACVALFILMLISVVMFSINPMYCIHIVWSIVFLVLTGAVLGIVFFVNKNTPFASVSDFAFVMFIMWALYMLIVLL